ncbi:VOC family protein [Marinobacter sp. CA1]|uniref:VOC family protein n=1 Tax=Marinobacter sp. CA1 TaxID=2817656 RepID=UPI001D08C479|nr:VOC family protein [Marinobacter sp. CA1]UDL06502.1 VOC family protein [Marinobacter sp. CA1]
MFSHITVGTGNLREATEFYNAVLCHLGFQQRIVEPDGGPLAACWVNGEAPLPRFYVYEPFNGESASAGNGAMVAFSAPSVEAVDQAFKAAIELGGADEGQPGEREHYGKGYYGAYLRDLDGNKIHLVYRGDVSA